MLATAKHPRTVALLKDAIAKATHVGTSASSQNGSATMLERERVSHQPVTRSVRHEGEKSVIPTCKISSYGKRATVVGTGFATGMPWAEELLPVPSLSTATYRLGPVGSLRQDLHLGFERSERFEAEQYQE